MDDISKEAYMNAEPEVRHEMMFDVQRGINIKLGTIDTKVGKLEACFKARKVRDRSFAGMMGFIGGFIAGLIKIFWK